MGERRSERRITHLIGVHETKGVLFFKRTRISVSDLDVSGKVWVSTRKIPDKLKNKKVLWASVNMDAKSARKVKPSNFQEV